MSAIKVGSKVVVRRGPFKGERGTVTNSPFRVFNGWTVKLDSGHIGGFRRDDLAVALPKEERDG